VAEIDLPSNYLLFNTLQTKNPILVIKIAGLNDLLTNSGINTEILYGDPGVDYGGPFVYGGTRPWSMLLPSGALATFRTYLDIYGGNPTLSQTLEIEQGKGSISTLNLRFIDFDGYMTLLSSPGFLIPEILGAQVDVFLGYQQTSYPTDFFEVYRGYITMIEDAPGAITYQISDPNVKRRTQIFYCAQTYVTLPVGISDTIISVQSNSSFFNPITGPDGTLTPSIHTYIQIDSEWIECIPIQQANGGYSAYIQGNTYVAQGTYTNGITVAYIGGGIAGSETVTVLGQAIVVKIQVGVSTALQVSNAVDANSDALNLVSIAVNPLQESLTQTTQAPTALELTTYSAAVIQGILYMGAPGVGNNVAITYVSGATQGNETASVASTNYYAATIQGITYIGLGGYGPSVTIQYVTGGIAGHETVTVTGPDIVVNIQVNVSTAATVANAVLGNAAAMILVQVILNPDLAGVQQSLQAPTNLVLTAYEVITVTIDPGVSNTTNVINALNTYMSSVGQWVTWELLPTWALTVQQVYPLTYLQLGLAGTQFAVINRAARQNDSSETPASAHDSGATVNAAVQIGDKTYTENAIDMSLKVMLSGWDGPWITAQPLLAIGPQPDSMSFIPTTNFITLPASIDAVGTYNLQAGDWILLSGSNYSSNNGQYFQIVRFADGPITSNQLIYLDATLQKEQSTPATVSFRSQYDVYPTTCGLRMVPTDIDIAGHLYVKNTFLGGNGNDYVFFITSTVTSAKEWLELQVYFPVGAYSLTRRGQVSVGYQAPPIANQNIVILTKDNVLEPQNIKIVRATNQRGFYNEIDVDYDYDDEGDPQSEAVFFDADSYTQIGILSVLQIQANGVYSGSGITPATLLQRRAYFYLQQYKRGAVTLSVKVNWQIASTTEAGDVAFIQDTGMSGDLQIANFNTGQRGLGNTLFKVIGRTFDIKAGNATLKLIGAVGASNNDRFAVISPSSIVSTGSTTTSIIIQDSFGALYPGDESKKWEQFVGQQLYVHSFDYSVAGTCTLNSIGTANIYQLNVSALGFTPLPGYIVDIVNYPNSVDPTVDSLYKLMFVFLDPTVFVATGIDNLNFTVSSGDISKFFVGAPIRIHDYNYVNDSGDLTIESITGTTIRASSSIGFVPTTGMLIDLIGFPDFQVSSNLALAYIGQPYRFI
jgi:hypothetical protein